MGFFSLKNKVGSLGEKLGSQYLRDKGYKILETNYCNTTGKRLGEIDIIAKKDGRTVFVEVKTRTVGAYAEALPEENIGRDKLRKLERIAACYLREKKLQDIPYAFDALAIAYDPDSEQADIRHLESIFL